MEDVIRVRTSLPLGVGSTSCDVVVVRSSNADLLLFASNHPGKLELLHSPAHEYVEVDEAALSTANIVATIKWANSEMKHKHIRYNSHIVNASFMDDIVAFQVMFNAILLKLHPPGLCSDNAVRCRVESITSTDGRNRSGQEVRGKIVRIIEPVDTSSSEPAAFDTPLNAVCGVWALSCPRSEIINVPLPVARYENDTVNTTVITVGNESPDIFEGHSYVFTLYIYIIY